MAHMITRALWQVQSAVRPVGMAVRACSSAASVDSLNFDSLHAAYKSDAATVESHAAQKKQLADAVAASGGQVVALHTSLLAAVTAPSQDPLMEAAGRPSDVPAGFDADTAQEVDEYSPVADPLTSGLLIDLDACTQTAGFSLHGTPDDRSDAKAELLVPDAAMLVSPAARKYVREVAGPRYQWQHNRLRLVSRKYATSAQNQRHVLEQAQAVMVEAASMEEEFGDFLQPRVTALPYGHRQRRQAKRRKGKAGLSF